MLQASCGSGRGSPWHWASGRISSSVSSPWARAQYRILCATPPPQLRLQAASLYRHLGQTGVRGRPGGAWLPLTSTPDQKGPGEGSLSGESLLHLHQEAQHHGQRMFRDPILQKGKLRADVPRKAMGKGWGTQGALQRHPSPTGIPAPPSPGPAPTKTPNPLSHCFHVTPTASLRLRTGRHTCIYVLLCPIYHLYPRPQPPASAP